MCRLLLPLCALLSLSAVAGAVEGPQPGIPLDPLVAPVVNEGDEPGRVAPAAPAKPVAIEFSWDGYHTLVVVGDGVGLMRPAWVATYEAPLLNGSAANLVLPFAGMFGYRQHLAVAYRAQAFLDAQGRLHIDARKAVIAGPMADEWFPDSFRFTLPSLVETLDDQDSGNQGIIDCVIDPAADKVLFETLQTRAQVLVGDGI